MVARDGLRVLGVARAYFRPGALPGEQHDFVFELLGLVGLADPVRRSVPSAVAECHAAGIRVMMITGDHPATAEAIARQVGLADGSVRTLAPTMTGTTWWVAVTPREGETPGLDW